MPPKKESQINNIINYILSLPASYMERLRLIKPSARVELVIDNAKAIALNRNCVLTPDILLAAVFMDENIELSQCIGKAAANKFDSEDESVKKLNGFFTSFEKILSKIPEKNPSKKNDGTVDISVEAHNVINVAAFFSVVFRNGAIMSSDIISAILLCEEQDGLKSAKPFKDVGLSYEYYTLFVRGKAAKFSNVKEIINSGCFTPNIDSIIGGESQEKKNLAPAGKIESDTEEEKKRKTKDLLDSVSQDITEQARKGELPVIVGREKEVERIIEILLRKTKSNPILTGPAGAGKSSCIELLAQKIASGDVPEELKDKTILTLELNSMVAGTMYRGQFEEKLKLIIDYLVSSDRKIIVFIDEIHCMVGAGSTSENKGGDMSNVLKPYLATGKISVIGATTEEEYNAYFKGEGALARRFQKVEVKEPDKDDMMVILNAVIPYYASYHKVEFDTNLKELIYDSCVEIKGRHFPDKAIDIVDEACVRAKTKGNRIVTQETISGVANRVKESGIKNSNCGFKH